MKNIFRFIYRSKYISDHQKRIWIFGIRKTFKCDWGISIQKNYKKTLLRLKKKYQNKEPLNVCFLVAESAKWQFQSLYDAMEKSDDFNPFVVVIPSHDSLDEMGLLEEVYNFFKKRNIRVYYGYDQNTQKYLTLSRFNSDIVFYQQPWGISYEQSILKTSECAICCYVPYAIVENEWSYDKIQHFINNLFFHFVTDKSVKEVYDNCHINTQPCVVTGHPKLDFALKIISQNKSDPEKKTIIYAPHHSFDKESFRWATFEWSGKAILEFAQKHPEMNWILKPHPRFKMALLNAKIMSEAELETYFKKWKEIGSVVTDGNYFELFGKSDLLITDCGSFLAECFLTQKPVIHLSVKDSYPHHPYNQQFIETYYNAWNTDELNQYLNYILLENYDSKKNERIELYEKMDYGHATENIITTIRKTLKEEK